MGDRAKISSPSKPEFQDQPPVVGPKSLCLMSAAVAAAAPASEYLSDPQRLPGSLDQPQVGKMRAKLGRAGVALRPVFAEPDTDLALFSFAFRLRRQKAHVFMTPACDSIFRLNSG